MGMSGLHLSAPAKVLLLTDQPLLAGAISLTLNHGSYTTRVMRSAGEAVVAIEQWQPHLAVIDIDVVGATLGALSDAAKGAGRLPMIALTRQGNLKARLDAFDRGADDVLTFPFAPEELLARVTAVFRRTHGSVRELTPAVKVSDLEIDIMTRTVRVEGHNPHLTSLELALLYLLASNAGETVSRDEIINHLWGNEYVADSNIVDRHVRNLRVKLNNSWRRPRYIFTVPRRGYSFLRTPASKVT